VPFSSVALKRPLTTSGRARVLFAGLLGGMVIVAEAEKALVAVLAAVGAGEEKIVEEEFFGPASSGPEGIGATAVGAFW
jgi:hypothetical protein